MNRTIEALLVSVLLTLAPPAGAATIPEVIYFHNDDGRISIHAMEPDGSGDVLVVSGKVDDYLRPRWAPDGSGFGFITRLGRRVEWMDVDGTNRHTLVSPGELPDDWHVYALAWSPHGTRLLLALSRWDHARARLYVYERNGSSSELIFHQPTPPDFYPIDDWLAVDWSVTGWIVATGEKGLLVMRPNGANEHELDGSDGGWFPRWSPDGSRIVYLCGGDVCAIDANGTNRERLTRTDAFDFSPTWSPTGARILWSRLHIRPRGGLSKRGHLWVMHADGGKAHRITDTPNVVSSMPDWR